MNKTLSRLAMGGGLVAALMGTQDLAQAQTTASASKPVGIESRAKDPSSLGKEIYSEIDKLKEGLSQAGYVTIYGNLGQKANEAKLAYGVTKNPNFLALQVIADMFAAWTARTVAGKVGANAPKYLENAAGKYRDALAARVELKKYDATAVTVNSKSGIKVADEGYIRENLDTVVALAPYRKK